jgi:hypothetical protein
MPNQDAALPEVKASSRFEHIAGELLAVEAALRKIIPADLEQRLLAQIPQWFLVIRLFKDIEISYTCLADRSALEPKYRAALTSIMALGDNIVAALADRPELDLSPIDTSREIVAANLRYLRDKYEQWFVAHDEAWLEAVSAEIEHARATAD